MKTIVVCAMMLTALHGQSRTAVWIDTDPSVQPGGHEVDDGFALIQAFHSPELAIRGVSVVFGNAPLAAALPIGREIVQRFGPRGLTVYSGASGADQLGIETEASRALATALRRERLTILALGPATNIATVLKNHPGLANRIERLIAVAGRRPGQHFITGPKSIRPLRDFNFEMDPQAFATILASNVPLALAPWEISSKVWLTSADLETLRRSNGAMQWIYPAASDWLKFWKSNFDSDGFNPFDTLAVAYVTSPSQLRCEDLRVAIQVLPDDTKQDATTKPYLLAGADIDSQRSARYCYEAAPEFKADLLARLARTSNGVR